MSEDKQTFTDPKSGQEIESTWLARSGGGLLGGLLLVLGLVPGWVLVLGLLFEGLMSEVVWGVVLVVGLGVVLMYGLLLGVSRMETVRRGPIRRLHDAIARTQHRRRRLHQGEHPPVPDETLSRADRPGDPAPSEAARSQAEKPLQEPEKKHTFMEPDTGEEMESPLWARLWPGLLSGFLLGVIMVSGGLVCGPIREQVVNQGEGREGFESPFPLWAGLLCMLGLGVVLGVIFGYHGEFIDPFFQRIHNKIARAHHRHRQRVLRSQDDQDVPDRALSRAQPPGEPTPTDAALSLADATDEKDRLAGSADTTENEVSVKE